MKIIISIIILLINFTVHSNQENPSIFLKNIVDETKPILIKKNNDFLEKTMEKYLDFNEIAIWITGKMIWQTSTNKQKIEFINELKQLMLRTYSKTVYYYIDSDITFIDPKIIKNKYDFEKRVQITSVIKKHNKNINISYRLIKFNNSWRVFDIIIEGISILKSLKTQYTDIIKTKGLNYTTTKIKILNNEQWKN